MTSNFLKASALTIVSVFCFALGDYLTQRIISKYSISNVLLLRTLSAFIVLFIFTSLTERKMIDGVLTDIMLYVWALVYALTILMYSFSSSKGELADVYVITSLMPIFIVLIDKFIRRIPKFNDAIWRPIFIMLASAVIANVYATISGSGASSISCLTGFAFAAAICHAVWTIVLDVIQNSHKITLTKLITYMFLFSALTLAVISFSDVFNKIEISIRNDIVIKDLFKEAQIEEFVILFLAGIFSALGVLLFAGAIKFAPPSSIAGFEYTIVVWAVVFSYLLPAENSETLVGVQIVRLICACCIVGGGFWLAYVNRNSETLK